MSALVVRLVVGLAGLAEAVAIFSRLFLAQSLEPACRLGLILVVELVVRGSEFGALAQGVGTERGAGSRLLGLRLGGADGGDQRLAS